MIALLGCTTSDCTYTVGVGSPDTKVSYTDSEGNIYEATTDSSGNVAVPCGSADTVERVRIALVESKV